MECYSRRAIGSPMKIDLYLLETMEIPPGLLNLCWQCRVHCLSIGYPHADPRSLFSAEAPQFDPPAKASRVKGLVVSTKWYVGYLKREVGDLVCLIKTLAGPALRNCQGQWQLDGGLGAAWASMMIKIVRVSHP